MLFDKQFGNGINLGGPNNDYDIACSFADFFNDKVKNISDKIKSQPLACTSLSSVSAIDSSVVDAGVMTLSEFESPPAADLSEVISGTGKLSRTCELDALPVPIAILKTCLDILMMPILQIVNLSLSTGIYIAAQWYFS